ncbi:MAG TPA: SgcJ/EcaC family oxidoreductase [Roseiarcus sp.]|nr:SgcJ/EcaC family oxidoreductase [Roseiarcus sp.]
MTDAEDTIEACLNRIKSAWDAGDAKTYEEEFAEDATYVIFLGEALLGRAAIEATHVDVFGKWQKGTKMAIRPLTVRALRDGVMSVLTVGGVGKAEPIRYDKFQTFTLIRRDGRWMCSAFQNTKMSPQAEEALNQG